MLYPANHVTGRRLPVLLDVYGGPGHQEVVRGPGGLAGAAVVGRRRASRWSPSTTGVRPGVAPSFEKAIHRRVADVILTDQVDALTALAGKHPDLDLGRVAIRGWSFGGWLAGLAVLRHPELFRARIVGRPGHRLGAVRHRVHRAVPGRCRRTAPTSTRHHSLLELAAEPPVDRPRPARPMLLVHGLVDDNVVAAHTLRLSAALLGAGRPHAVLPLTGATHMAAGGLAERLLRLELDFLRTHLT